MKGFVKNVSYAIISNGVSFLASALVTLVVPKFISVESYGYLQLYIFYSSYIGICCLGWIDGIVLRYAGFYYEKLDYPNFKSQFLIYSFTQIVIAATFIGLTDYFVVNINERIVYLLLGLEIALASPCSFFRYLLQAVGKIREYSVNLLIERTVYTVLVLVGILFWHASFVLVILADLVGKFVAFICMLFTCKYIMLAKCSAWRKALKEGWTSIRCGIKLLAANEASYFIVGIVRYAVQLHWDVVAFAKVSFALSISNLFMVFIRAVSIVLLPQLKRVTNEKLPHMYLGIRALLVSTLFAMLIVYYPVSSILSLWLPQYAESLRYMGLLFPICIFESKNSLLIETYLKAYRKEKVLLIINCITVCGSLLLAYVTVFAMSNLELAMLSVVILLWFRCGLSELVIEKVINKKLKIHIMKETALVIVFIVCSWLITGWIGAVLYAMAYIVYVIIERKNLPLIKELFFSI